MNIFFIGSSGALSLLPFQTLLASQHSISAVGVNSPVYFDKKIIALQNESLALAANQQQIPLIDLSAPVTEIIAYCENLAIDVLLVSCYNKRLPAEIIKLASYGGFNMHPSLLPGFRGPEPVFWQMKQASDMGVSWHHLIAAFDAGDVVQQKKVFIDDGADYIAINKQLAAVASKLMLDLLTKLSTDELVATVQDPKMASYYAYPQHKDFVIDTNLTAQQLYNFMRATAVFSYTYRCQLEKSTFILDKALDYDNNCQLDTAEVEADRLFIPCKEGVLIASYTDKIVL